MYTPFRQEPVARCMHMRRHAQVVIMTTPLAAFFKCQYQDGYMWLFAIGVGSGSLLVSLLTKLLTRCARVDPSGSWLPDGSMPRASADMLHA